MFFAAFKFLTWRLLYVQVNKKFIATCPLEGHGEVRSRQVSSLLQESIIQILYL